MACALVSRGKASTAVRADAPMHLRGTALLRGMRIAEAFARVLPRATIDIPFAIVRKQLRAHTNMLIRQTRVRIVCAFARTRMAVCSMALRRSLQLTHAAVTGRGGAGAAPPIVADTHIKRQPLPSKAATQQLHPAVAVLCADVRRHIQLLHWLL
jgi:hypothetical protein